MVAKLLQLYEVEDIAILYNKHYVFIWESTITNMLISIKEGKRERRRKGKREEKKGKRRKKGKRTRTPRRRVMTCVVWGAGLCEAPRPPRASKHVITLLRGGSQALLYLSHLVLPPPPHRKTLRKDWLNGRCEKTLFFLKTHF